MLECDGLRPEVAEAMRGVDLLLAPSTYVTEMFRRWLPGMPVYTLPNVVDPRVYPGAGRNRTNGADGTNGTNGTQRRLEPCTLIPELLGAPPFLFCCVSTSHPRKHLLELLHAFAEEFHGESREVGLVVKTGEEGAQIKGLAASCRAYGAWVKVFTDHWSDEQLAELYSRANVFALPSHEGFGLPFCESALYGTPSVALNIGGQTDVVTEETGYLCPAVMAPCVGQHPRYFSSEFCWASCGVPELRATLRHAYIVERLALDFEASQRAEWARRFGTGEQTRGLVDEIIPRPSRGDRARAAVRRFFPNAVAPDRVNMVDLAKELWLRKQV
jgi:glycosyltransferase involved in cell wall biosynthesis